jgi:hypothetical protein
VDVIGLAVERDELRHSLQRCSVISRNRHSIGPAMQVRRYLVTRILVTRIKC